MTSHNPHKIFFFGSDYPPTGGGISTYTKEWLFAISNEKEIEARARIFGNKNPRVENVSDIQISIVKSVNFFYVGFVIFLDIIKFRKSEVLHSFNIFPVGFWVIFWSKVFFKKGIITFYGADACDSRTTSKVRFLQKWSIKNAYKAITISQFTKNKIVDKYKISGENIEVIYPVLPKNESKVNKDEIESIKVRLDVKDTDFIVLSVSRLVKRKGIEYLIEAISKIEDQNVKAIIVGGGPEREALDNKVKSLGLENRIFFAGRVSSLSEYYSIANIAVLLSYDIESEGDFEGLGLVLLEAQSNGLPVVGTNSGGIPEAFEDGETGILVPELDSNSIAQAIIKLKGDKTLYEKMSKATPDFLNKRFGLENTIKKYIVMLCKK